MKHRIAPVSLIATLLAITVLGSAPVAVALESPAKVGGASVEHCVLNMDTGRDVCVGDARDIAAAVLEETGYVLVYGEERGLAASDAAVAATYVLGTFYSYPNYGGSSRAVSGANPCSAGYAYSYADLGSIGWNDDIDSFKSFNGCQTKVWEHTGFTGTSYGYATNVADLGSMRNRASSIKWG